MKTATAERCFSRIPERLRRDAHDGPSECGRLVARRCPAYAFPRVGCTGEHRESLDHGRQGL